MYKLTNAHNQLVNTMLMILADAVIKNQVYKVISRDKGGFEIQRQRKCGSEKV